MPGPFYFAWAGGAIEEQQTLVTNGNTHGGVLQTVALVGDLDAGGSQVRNLASANDLEAGGFYGLAGPGVAAGTFFTVNDALSGSPSSINLSLPATATAKSVTLLATKAAHVGVTVGTLAPGSDVVYFADDIGLPAGTYSIAGLGIGVAGDIEVVSAFFNYDGSGSGVMWTLVAYADQHSGHDQFGQPITITNWIVGSTPVTATLGGDYPVEIIGPPSADWFRITGIPLAALATLSAGLKYNVSGNGVQEGTTFVAPAVGATEIQIDLPTTSAGINAILTITGPRTPNAAWDPSVHDRFDEDVFSIEIAQEEGGFATLTIELRNSAVGLLTVGRNLWCWLSWDQAWTPDGAAVPDLVPLFNGRLIGVPQLQANEIVQLQFMARPDDYNAQKAALAGSLQVLPYWDPVWLAANTSADTVLETYSSLWHIDRTTLTVLASDIVQGEAGTVTIGEDKAFYDNFSLSYGEPPLVAVTVSGTVSWQQQAEGLVDLTQTLVGAFDAALAAPYGNSSGIIECMNGEGLKNDWPKPGTTIGGGWSLTTQIDSSGNPLCSIVEASRNSAGGWLQPFGYTVSYVATLPIHISNFKYSPSVEVFSNPASQVNATFPINSYKISMYVEYRADRKRTETVSAVMVADVQRELSDSTDSEQGNVELSSDYVSQGVDPGGGVPIGDLSRRSYFQTDRGASSFEYLLLAARAKLRARARAVDLTFAVDWRTALGLTLRHSVTYIDRRLPGGAATGKVKSYRLTASDTMLGEFTIGCTIGNGTPSQPAVGTNAYVDDGYAVGYQMVAGGQVALLDEELAYQTLDNFVISDDGLDLSALTAATVVNFCTVVNGLEAQLAALNQFNNSIPPTHGNPLDTARALTTTVTLDLKPVTGAEFHTDFFPAVTQLSLPKTIDLGAS